MPHKSITPYPRKTSTREEWIEALRESNLGQKRTSETSKNIGESQRKLWSDPAYKAKMIEKRKKQGKIAKETGLASLALKKKWQDPVYREKMVAVRKLQGEKQRRNVSEVKISVGIRAAKTKRCSKEVIHL